MNLSSIDNLQLQRANIEAFACWISFGIINSIFAVWNLAVLNISKSLTNITLHLATQMSVIETCGGIANAVIGSYHLYYVKRNIPETNTSLNCFLIGGVSYMYFVSSLALLYLSLSFDRCFSNLTPKLYAKYSSLFKYFLIVLTYFVPIVIVCLGFLDVPMNTYTSMCILRKSLSLFGFLMFTYSMLGISFLGVSVYGLVVVILKLKLRTVRQSGGNVAEIATKVNSKVTIALAGNALFHLLTFTLAASGNIVVTFMYDKGANFGPYFVPLYHLGGVTSFITYFTFHSQFRSGSKHLVRKLVCSKTEKISVTAQNVNFINNTPKVVIIRKRSQIHPSNTNDNNALSSNA